VYSISSLRQSPWSKNHALTEIIRSLNPAFILWNIGVISFLYQELPIDNSRVHIGILTSPLYTVEEIRRVGWVRLIRHLPFTFLHVIGALSPDCLLKNGVNRNPFNLLVCETNTTAQRAKRRFWGGSVKVIPPGVDDVRQFISSCALSLRSRLGFSENEFLVGYFGALHPIRGVHTLIRSISSVQRIYPQIRLLILSRPTSTRAESDLKATQLLIRKLCISDKIRLLEAMFSPAELMEWLMACDLIALPFELVPSDAPLSLLEAQALGKSVVTTRLASLPELLNSGGYLAEPGDVASLTQAIYKATRHRADPSQPCAREFTALRTWQVMGHEWSELISSL
jgi:glycosyltransferase involved in cell wall biosynthesis